jgi:hypothetical protein
VNGKGEISGVNCLSDDLPQSGFVDMNFAFVEHVDDFWVNIHAQNYESVGGEGRCSRQTNISESDDTELSKIHWCSLWSDILRAGQL